MKTPGSLVILRTRRIHDAAQEQYRTGLVVLDQEYERMVCPEYRDRIGTPGCSSKSDYDSRRGSSLSALLVYINKSLVDNITDEEVFCPVHT